MPTVGLELVILRVACSDDGASQVPHLTILLLVLVLLLLPFLVAVPNLCHSPLLPL